MDNRILIFRIGSLGDTLVAVPSIWTVRDHFPNARLTLLCDHHAAKNYVSAADLLANTSLIDDVMSYPVIQHGIRRWFRPLRMLQLLWRLRRRRFDTLVYLAPTDRAPQAVRRDENFFRLAGIKRMIGMTGFAEQPKAEPGQLLPMSPRVSDLLLQRLANSGLTVPPRGQLRTDLDLGPAEHAAVQRWRSELPPDGGRRWIAIGPGSKMPAKIWPADRYEQVVRKLIERFDVWPVIFGGSEDREVGQRLLAAWGRGYNAAGALGLRPAAAAIGLCAMYLGNDTGTMHLAAAAGVRCVAIFSAHSVPGLWYPTGDGHRIFRTQIECENCKLIECVDRQMECIRRIGVEEVYQGCVDVLEELGVGKLSSSSSRS